jgi:hypothetical protein
MSRSFKNSTPTTYMAILSKIGDVSVSEVVELLSTSGIGV